MSAHVWAESYVDLTAVHCLRCATRIDHDMTDILDPGCPGRLESPHHFSVHGGWGAAVRCNDCGLILVGPVMWPNGWECRPAPPPPPPVVDQWADEVWGGLRLVPVPF